MKNVRRLIAVLGLVGCIALPAPAPAGLGLDVSPAKFEFSMPSGNSYTIPLTVHNSTPETTHIVATMVDFGVGSSGDYEIGKTGTRPYSLLRYASINPREFDLPGNTTQQVRLSVALPSAPLKGEYAGIVFFQTRPTRQAHAVSFSARIGTKLYLTIPGTLKVDGSITKMTATPSVSGELYRVQFKNAGNAHVYLRGQIDVRKDGTSVDRVVMPAEMLVERGGYRLIEVNGKKLAPGKYQAIATIDYGGKTMTGGEIEFSAH